MDAEDIKKLIQQFFADKSRTPQETRQGLEEIAEECEMLCASLPTGTET